MFESALPDSFEYLYHGSTTIINVFFTPSVRGSTARVNVLFSRVMMLTNHDVVQINSKH